MEDRSLFACFPPCLQCMGGQCGTQSLSSPLRMNPNLNQVAMPRWRLFVFGVGDKSHRLILNHRENGQVGAEGRITRGPLDPFCFTPSREAWSLPKRGVIHRKKLMRSLRRPTEIGNIERHNNLGKLPAVAIA